MDRFLVLGGQQQTAGLLDFEFAEFSRLNPDLVVSTRGNSLGSTPTLMSFASDVRVKIAGFNFASPLTEWSCSIS